MHKHKNFKAKNQMERREIFSIRKFNIGVASALIGMTFFGSQVVLAEKAVPDEVAQYSTLTDPDTKETDETENIDNAQPAESLVNENEERISNTDTSADDNVTATTSEENTTPATESKPEEKTSATKTPSNEGTTASKVDSTCCKTVRQYEIIEDKDKEYGYAEKTAGKDVTKETITLGVKPKIEEKDNTIRKTRYEVARKTYDKDAHNEAIAEDTQVASPDMVENIDGLNKIEKGKYTDLVKAYETVEAKDIKSIEDTLQVQQFGEEGVLDLNKVFDWMEKHSDKPVMTEFKIVGSDNTESYLAVFKGADGRKWVSTNKSEDVVSSTAKGSNPTEKEKNNKPFGAHFRDIYTKRTWKELTPNQTANKSTSLGGLYNIINNLSTDPKQSVGEGSPLLTVINDSKNVTDRQNDNKAYMYNFNVDKNVTYTLFYRTATCDAQKNGTASPFDTVSSAYTKSDWKTFTKNMTLKPHLSYHPEVHNKNAGENNPVTEDERTMLAQNEYRRALTVDIKPKTEKVTLNGKMYYKYTEYSLNQKTGEKVVTKETLVPVEEVPDNQSRTNFVTEGVALTLPKLIDGNVVLTHKALLQTVYDRKHKINKQSILEDYYDTYDARKLDKNPEGYDDLFTRDDTTRRATEMDNRRAIYNANHRPIREDVRREILGEIAEKNAPFFRNVTLTPNVTVNHYLEDGTLLKTETKAATETLDPYFKKGSPEFLKDYEYVRSDIDEQEYIYKRVANPKYYTKGFGLISDGIKREGESGKEIESMGTVAPPYTALPYRTVPLSFKSSTSGSNAGFALTYDNYAIVEPVSHERAKAVRNGQEPDYCVAEEARHIRTINVYYKKIPRKSEVPNEYPTATKPKAAISKKEVKGNVVVHYVDENGKVIAKEQTLPTRVVKTNTYVNDWLAETVETHETYDATTATLKPSEIPFEGKIYQYIRTHENSKPEKGEYIEGTLHVTYVYKLISSETPKPEEPKPEAPKPEAPKPEAPKPEAPKPEAPKPEQPKPEQPKPEQPKPEQPKPEQPKPEQPKPEQPKPEAPKPEQPKPEQPKPEAPKPEAPKPEAPKPEQPKPEQPKPEQPKSEAPKPEAPKPEAPKPEQPKPEAPKQEQPKQEHPTAPEKPDDTEQRTPEFPIETSRSVQKSALLPNTGESTSLISLGVGAVVLLVGLGFVIAGRKKK
ncbi:YSIRK-type signal peptide-containing protein [Tuanshanicoccus lijuaniae]|uniref:YSIRK-type signal peptide-containing protein n=1 Tax=Aerococcaceae bacterium zg-1292 TaxID=2774330 RepID=UPI0040629F8E